MNLKWYSMPTFRKWFRKGFYVFALLRYLFGGQFSRAILYYKKRISQFFSRHRKRAFLYSICLVILLVLIFANIKIAHLDDNLETNYCTNFDSNNLPPTCQKIANENNQYDTLPSPPWRDIYAATSTKDAFLAAECDSSYHEHLWEAKIKVDNNETALEILKQNCLQILNVVETDFDGDREKEIAMITSGAGCVSCHGQEVRIIKGDKVIFYKEGENFTVLPTKDFIGFLLKYPLRKDGEGYCCPSEGVVESYKLKAGGSELETFYKIDEKRETY